MQSVSSRIWTRIAVSISYEDNHYTTVSIFVFIDFHFVIRPDDKVHYSMLFFFFLTKVYVTANYLSLQDPSKYSSIS